MRTKYRFGSLFRYAPSGVISVPMPSLPRMIVYLSLVLTLLGGLATFSVTTRSTGGYLVWSDGLAYFLYARSAVIDRDFDITNEYNSLNERHPADSKLMVPLRTWVRHEQGTESVIAPWPIGTGLVLGPFYAVGYLAELFIASVQGREPDSYGLIPQYFFCTSSLFFGFLGFWAVYLCCGHIASSRIALLSAFGVVLGGPAVFYIFFNPSMAHASSFGLVALLTWLWWNHWSSGARPWSMALLGLLVGIVTTIRYQNVLFGLLPLALLARDALMGPRQRLLLATAASALAFLIPLALLFAQQHTPLVDTSGGISLDSGGRLKVASHSINLTSPYFLDVLWSCRHGAFHWAPVLALGCGGLVCASAKEPRAIICLLIVLAHVYLIGGLGLLFPSAPGMGSVTGNWETHWSGAPSFGMRYLTECGPLLAIGLAFLVRSSSKWVPVGLWAVVLCALVVWNGLLIVAYGLETISRSQCVTYADLLSGVLQAITRFVPIQAL